MIPPWEDTQVPVDGWQLEAGLGEFSGGGVLSRVAGKSGQADECQRWVWKTFHLQVCNTRSAQRACMASRAGSGFSAEVMTFVSTLTLPAVPSHPPPHQRQIVAA